MRLERLQAVFLVKLLYWIIGNRVLEIPEHTRLGRTDLDASRFESSSDAVVTERALLCRFGDGIEKAAAVRAGLNAKTTADAVLGINQHRSVWGVKSGTHRANLDARGVMAQIA